MGDGADQGPKKSFPGRRRTKTFDRSPGRRAVQIVKVPSVDAAVEDATARCQEIASRLSPMELKFLGYYYQSGSAAKAYKMLRKGKPSDPTCYVKGSLVWKGIKAKVSGDELWELMGASLGKIGKVLDEGMSATFRRSFITRDGQVVESPEYPDHPTRLHAAALSAKIRKLTSEDGGPPVTVSVISYCPPGTPPWPTGPSEIDVTPRDTSRDD